MSCSCHGKHKRPAEVVLPKDQCTACAYKHVKNAWAAWDEFQYSMANRDWVSAQLRLAIEHLKLDNRETAIRLRDIALDIEHVNDESADIAERLYAALDEVRALFLRDNPDTAKALETKCNGGTDTVDA